MSLECHLLKASSHCLCSEFSWLVANGSATCSVGARGKCSLLGGVPYVDSDSVKISTDVGAGGPDFNFGFACI